MPTRPPIAFLSYSWEGDAHESWVMDIARRLRRDHVDALLDRWETQPGDDLAEFMESGIARADFVLIFCTPTYREKASRPHGGVRFEGTIMTGALVTGTPRRKFIPILRGSDWVASAPSWLLGSFYVDFRHDPASGNGYSEVLDTLHNRGETAPPIGGSPDDGVATRSATPDPAPSKGKLGEEHDDSWPFVWKQLFDAEPHDAELTHIGYEWLRATPNEKAWPFVWQALVERDPRSQELRWLGLEWLRRSDSPSWSHIWHAMSELDPHSEELQHLGREYLRRSAW